MICRGEAFVLRCFAHFRPFLEMPDKPAILFVAILHPGFVHYHAEEYGGKHIFDVLPHKLSVLALVGWLREHGCEGHYVWLDYDKAYSEEALNTIDKAISEYKPDAIGFSLCTEEVVFTYKFIEQLKRRHPEIPIILGGPHVSAVPDRTLRQFPLVDYVVIGEGELTLTELLGAIASGKRGAEMREVMGLAYRDESAGIVVTEPRERIEDINVLPEPAYDLIFDSHTVKDVPFSIICSSGCPFHCTFCTVEHGHFRYFEPMRIVDRIEAAQKRYGAKYFAMRDSFWPPTREWLNIFCDEVEKRGLKFQFYFLTRVGALEEKHYDRLRRIGAKAVALGVEAGDPVILKNIRKAITIEQARKTFRALHAAGILSVSFFLFGNQGENRKTIRASIDLSHELNASVPFFNVLAAFPGCEVYKLLPESEKDWWMDGRVYPSICDLPTPEIMRLAREALIRYPLRWAYLKQHVFNGKLNREFRRICWKFYLVQLRRYMLGMAERFWLTRKVIGVAKSLLGHK